MGRRTKTPDGKKVQPPEPPEPATAGDKEVMRAVDETPNPYQSVSDDRQPKNFTHRPSSVATTERRYQALQLRRDGYGFDEIGAQMNCGKSVAFRLVKGALWDMTNTINENVREIYKGEWHKLDLAEQALWPRVMQGSVEAIDRFLKIQAQRARLFGLNAPEGVNHYHQGSVDINLSYESDKDL